MTTETITIRFREDGARQVNRSLGEIAGAAGRADGMTRALRRAVERLAGPGSGRALAEYAERWWTVNRAIAEQYRLLDEILGPARRYGAAVATLNDLLAENVLSQDQVNVALRDARIQYLDSLTSMEAGFERAFLRMGKVADDWSRVSEQSVLSFADHATDALVDLAKTGRFNFKQFADAVITDILRMTIKMMVFRAISSLGGLGGGGAASQATSAGGDIFAGGGFRHGGAFTVGGAGPPDSRLVAFRASPGERVTVETPAQQRRKEHATARALVVNVTVNARDADSFAHPSSQMMLKRKLARAVQAASRGL